MAEWTGAGTTLNWSEGANWTMGVPVNGQALCFTGVGAGSTLNDDITGLSVTGLDFQGAPSPNIAGKSLSVTSSITAGAPAAGLDNPILLTGVVTVHGALELPGQISGSGSLVVTQNYAVQLLSPNNDFTGGVTVDGPSSGRLVASSLGTGPVVVQHGGELDITATVDNAISLAGTGLYGFALGCYNGSSLNGPITLASDSALFNYAAAGPVVMPAHICTVNGVISGPHALTLEQNSFLTTGLAWHLTAANTYIGGTAIGGPGNEMGNVIASGSSPLGTGPVTIRDGRTSLSASALHAIGRVGAVALEAPHGQMGADDGNGNPGTLTVDALTLSSGALLSLLTSPTANSTVESLGTVTIGSATLHIDVRGFQPAPGDAFTVIRNDSGVPVTGTFAGLPEGAVLEAYDGSAFVITYRGNGRNDVVLTAVPPVPDTGTSVSAGLAILSVGVVLLLLAIPMRRYRSRVR